MRYTIATLLTWTTVIACILAVIRVVYDTGYSTGYKFGREHGEYSNPMFDDSHPKVGHLLKPRKAGPSATDVLD